jgi:hypothetical protein
MMTTTKFAEIVSMLVEVARAAHYAMDDCGDLLLTEDGAEKLSNALGALDELPEIDDGYVRDGWCKAKDWLIALNAYTAPQPSADAVREVPDGLKELREKIEALQEFKPWAHKHPHSGKGFVTSMRKSKPPEQGEEYGWVNKGTILAMLSAASGEKGVG